MHECQINGNIVCTSRACHMNLNILSWNRLLALTQLPKHVNAINSTVVAGCSNELRLCRRPTTLAQLGLIALSTVFANFLFHFLANIQQHTVIKLYYSTSRSISTFLFLLIMLISLGIRLQLTCWCATLFRIYWILPSSFPPKVSWFEELHKILKFINYLLSGAPKVVFFRNFRGTCMNRNAISQSLWIVWSINTISFHFCTASVSS